MPGPPLSTAISSSLYINHEGENKCFFRGCHSQKMTASLLGQAGIACPQLIGCVMRDASKKEMLPDSEQRMNSYNQSIRNLAFDWSGKIMQCSAGHTDLSPSRLMQASNRLKAAALQPEQDILLLPSMAWHCQTIFPASRTGTRPMQTSFLLCSIALQRSSSPCPPEVAPSHEYS